MDSSIVIIMAGGLGKRMNSDLPKVLHNILEKPMLVHIINQAKLINPIKILIVVGKYKNIIKQTLEQYMDININKQIVFIDQPIALGTGHAIQCCRDELLNYDDLSKVIILSGDVPLLKFSTINNMLENFNKVKIVTTKFNNPDGYGRIIEKNNKFLKIVEQKDCNEEEKLIKRVNCGIYIIQLSILCKYLPYLSNNNSQNEYYLTDIIEIIKINENIVIDIHDISEKNQYQIMGINTSEQLLELEKLMI